MFVCVWQGVGRTSVIRGNWTSGVSGQGFDKYRSEEVIDDIKTHSDIEIQNTRIIQYPGRITFIFIIMITTIPKHSKKDNYRLKSIL